MSDWTKMTPGQFRDAEPAKPVQGALFLNADKCGTPDIAMVLGDDDTDGALF